jgi:glycosyltransferase involved in cell wall biosynthesis
MHILQVTPYFPPYPGGQERFVYALSRELVRKGHRVTVLTSNFPKGDAEEVVEGIRIFRFPCLARPLRNPITPQMVWTRKIPDDIDLIHAHNEHSFASNIAPWINRRINKPLVITCHGTLVFDSRLADSIRWIYSRTVGKAMFRFADRITVATPSEKRRIISEYGIRADRIDLVPVGIDLQLWDAAALAQKSTERPNFDFSGKKIILVATQLIKRKGIQYLIKAMPAIVSREPNVILAIAGSGSDENYLRELVAELRLEPHVDFIGQLEMAGLAAVYQRADVFVLPSLGEGQPTCIMEAWAYSKAVVATRIEGVVDYFDGAAMLVPPADPASLADAVVRLLNDRRLAAEIGARGRHLVESSFTWEQVGGRMLATYMAASQVAVR